MNEWREWAYLVGAFAQTLFVFFYGTSNGWWRHFVGRALFLKSLNIMIVFDVIVIAIYWPFAHQDFVFTVLIWGVTCSIIYQLYALLRQRFFAHDYFEEGSLLTAVKRRLLRRQEARARERSTVND